MGCSLRYVFGYGRESDDPVFLKLVISQLQNALQFFPGIALPAWESQRGVCRAVAVCGQVKALVRDHQAAFVFVQERGAVEIIPAGPRFFGKAGGGGSALWLPSRLPGRSGQQAVLRRRFRTRHLSQTSWCFPPVRLFQRPLASWLRGGFRRWPFPPASHPP